MVRVRAWLGLGLVLASQASYAIMLQVYDDYYVLTAIYHIGSFSHHAQSLYFSLDYTYLSIYIIWQY